MLYPRGLFSFLATLAAFIAAAPSASANCFDLLVEQMHGVVSEGKFETFRGLHDYHILLGESFTSHLKKLTRDSLWIDMGAGSARAQKEYLGLEQQSLWRQITRGKANTLAVGFRRPKTNFKTVLTDRLVEDSAQHHELFGRLVEDIPDEELGRADLITDVFGPLAYTERLGLVLNKYLRVLNDDGAIYVHMANLRTTIYNSANKEYTLPQWLRTVPGLKIEEDTMSFTIRKTSRFVEVPRLKIIGGSADVPPLRVFRAP